MTEIFLWGGMGGVKHIDYIKRGNIFFSTFILFMFLWVFKTGLQVYAQIRLTTFS